MVLAALFRGRPESSGAHAGDGRWAQRLLNTVQDAASDVILYDTTGFIEAIDQAACTVTVETPLAHPEATAVMHLGDVHLDPDTYQDRRP